MKEPSLQTRRAFLRSTLLGGAMTWTVPSFFHLTMRSLYAETLDVGTAPRTGKDDTILVVLQLAGGNDGLNTLVPWNNDFYYKARPRLALPGSSLLRVNDELAFHSALTGMQALFEEGKLAIIQGVGYPNPNRSHFRSMEIWQTASDADRSESLGWIGRYFDHQCAGEDVTVGVHVGSTPPQAFAARMPKGITVPAGGAMGRRGPARGREGLMQVRDDAEMALDGGSIDMFGGGGQPAHGFAHPLDFLERTQLDAQVSSEQIGSILRGAPADTAYPGSRLGSDLQTVGRLIGGGMTTRIYYVSQGGYDTHANQAGAHDRLLRELGDALHAFAQDMERQGNFERVVIMTFSEFGRRVQENANGGTDHGAAAPVFITGGAVKGGLYEKMPSLNPADLWRGDVQHAVDFRSIYATLLERHLASPSQPVLGRPFDLLDFI